MNEERFQIRIASIEDVDALAVMHVAAWRETYSGILPASMLAGLSVEGRAKAWRRIMAEGGVTTVRLVECEKGIVAFGSCTFQRDAALKADGFDGEISTVYVLRAFQRTGLGLKIMHDLAEALIGRGCQGTALWVLRENRAARSFYEKLGGVVVGGKVDERPSGSLVELAYGWRDLETLLGRTKPSRML